MVELNGTVYAFDGVSNQVMTIDLGSGSTSFAGNIDPSAGVIAGAASPVPEPGSVALMFAGLVFPAIWGARRLRLPRI